MSEVKVIKNVIQGYIDGGVSGQSEQMKSAFHEKATMYYIADGEIQGGPIQGLFDAVDSIGVAADLTGKFADINVNETTATVRLELYNWSGARYTDQLSLLKIHGEWKIISKVYHQH